MNPQEITTDEKRVVYPSYHNIQNSSTAVMSVLLADNEDVKWHWHHSSSGSIVIGYTIVKNDSIKI